MKLSIPAIVLAIISVVAHSAIFYKLSSLGPSTLTAADYLTSTLGHFRITLKPITCQLQIQAFNKFNYNIVGYFPRTALASCGSLSVVRGALVSNNNQSIISLKNSQLGIRYDQVMVTVDETSIIRISGMFLNQYHTSQNWISMFRSPQQYVYAISNLSVTNYHSLSFIQNNGNWGFSATNGQLRIFRVQNSSKIRRYNYTAFTMTPSNLFDYNSNPLPFADFTDFQYAPKCKNSNNLALQGPFTFTINPFFPEMRVLDQTGYEIVSIRFPQTDCSDTVGVSELEGNPRCVSWFCPQNMFEYEGSCVTACPAPYFHQLGQNGINRCVLVCRQDYNRDNILRICSCSSPALYPCPQGLKATAFGCLCSSGTYFNSLNKPANSSSVCLSSCGLKMFPHRDGLCVPCPLFCLNCILSGNSYNYLKCTQCEPQYILSSEGLCIKDCNSSIGKVQVKGQCLSCAIKFCKNCSGSINRCISCLHPYALYDNTCLVDCPQGFRALMRADDTFECVLNAKCPATFTSSNSSANNQSQCLCSTSSNKFTFISNCSTQSPPCLFDQYYDSATRECLRCPVGCLTCSVDNNNKVECTSCRPDYSMFITLRKNHYCERKSILSYCAANYSDSKQMCQVNNMVAMASILPYRNLCLSSIKNCMVCLTDSKNQCSICHQGFYLNKGLCFSQCPQNSTFYPYQPVCIDITTKNCLQQVTQKTYWQFNKDSINQNADGLFYMLTINFQMTDPLNDPKGSVFLYSSRSVTTFDARPIDIAYSRQKCQLCTPGFGLTYQGSCLPCPRPCLECIYVSTKSCLKCDSFHRLSNSSCVKLDPTQMPCVNNEFRNESLMCQNKCLQFYRPDYQVKVKNNSFMINCTFNCPDNYQIVPSVMKNGDSLLKCQLGSVGSQTENQWVKFFGWKVKTQFGSIFMLISSKKLTFSNDNVGTVRPLSQSIRLLQQQNPNNTLVQTSFGFVYIDSQNNLLNQEGVVLELNPANIQVTESYLGNSQYTINSNTKAPIDIIHNETGGLYTYGRVMTCLLFFATVVFMGQQLTYKTDNLFITFSVLYLLLPSVNLIPSTEAFAVYSFLYGFAWSSYLQFLGNPRSFTASTSWFNGYLQQVNNNAHHALYVDNNFIRNCWSILLFLAIAVPICIILITIFKILSHGKNSTNNNIGKHIGRQQTDIDHCQSAKCMLTFLVQNSFIGLTYYSIINLLNNSWLLAPSGQQVIYKGISAGFMVFVIAYTLLRWYANSIGGIYCLKRVLLGLSLGMTSYWGGIDQNIPIAVSLLVTIEVLFIFLRYKYQMLTSFLTIMCCRSEKNPVIKDNLKQPKSNKIIHRYSLPDRLNTKPQNSSDSNSEDKSLEMEIPQNTQKQKFLYLIIEQILIIVVYISGVLASKGGQGAVVVIWLILLTLLVSVGIDFFDMISIFKDKFGTSKKEVNKPYLKKIRTLWDHDLSLKSLAQTNTD